MPTKDEIDIPQGLYQVEEEDNQERERWADDNPCPRENPYVGIQKLSEAVKDIGVAATVAVRAIQKLMSVASKYAYKQYPNRRVVYLALYGKRARTRKKNRNRILRDFKRELNRTKVGGNSDEKNVHGS